jgi:hypothetical protein
MFCINQLPVQRLIAKDKWYKQILETAAKLICITVAFAELWQEVMKTSRVKKLQPHKTNNATS